MLINICISTHTGTLCPKPIWSLWVGKNYPLQSLSWNTSLGNLSCPLEVVRLPKGKKNKPSTFPYRWNIPDCANMEIKVKKDNESTRIWLSFWFSNVQRFVFTILYQSHSVILLRIMIVSIVDMSSPQLWVSRSWDSMLPSQIWFHSCERWVIQLCGRPKSEIVIYVS